MNQSTVVGNRRIVWTGRIISGIAVAFLVLDAVGKLLLLPQSLESTVELGYRADDVRTLGVLLAVSTVLYAIPRTAMWGAILLTGYLGGALAAHLRIGNPLATHVLSAIYFAAFVWIGFALRSPALVRLLRGGSQAD